MKEQKHYAERDAMALGKYYTAHVSAMTREKLFTKSDIAAELAHRDKIIAGLKYEFYMGVCYAAAEIAEENPVVASELLRNAGLFRKKAIEIGVDSFDFLRIEEARAWPKVNRNENS